jgi:hypothetical protein
MLRAGDSSLKTWWWGSGGSSERRSVARVGQRKQTSAQANSSGAKVGLNLSAGRIRKSLAKQHLRRSSPKKVANFSACQIRIPRVKSSVLMPPAQRA